MRAHGNRQRDGAGLAGRTCTGVGARPGKERQQASGRPFSTAVIQVVGTGIIEVHGDLHQSQTQHPRVKQNVPFRISGNRSNVMEAKNTRHKGDVLSIQPAAKSCSPPVYSTPYFSKAPAAVMPSSSALRTVCSLWTFSKAAANTSCSALRGTTHTPS